MKQEKRKAKPSKEGVNNGTSGAGTPSKRRAEAPAAEEALPSWVDHQGLFQVRMRDSQVLLFTGQGVLQVLQGVVAIDGYLLTPEHAPLDLSTTSCTGTPAITITGKSRPHQVQTPYAGSTEIKLSIHNPPHTSESSSFTTLDAATPASTSSAADTEQLFQLHLPASQPLQSAAAGAGGRAGQRPVAAAAPVAVGTGGAGWPITPAGLNIPNDWSRAIGAVMDASTLNLAGQGPLPAVAVVGPKGVGKSSLSRLLVNQLLNQHPVVALMDTDCGQAEITPAGMVSVTLLTQPLLGPPCTHVQQISHGHYIGDTSPQSDPRLYGSALASLYSWYASEACAKAAAAAAATRANAGPGAGAITGDGKSTWPPLVINTHGWVKGMGLDLVTDLINVIGPSHVIQVRSRHEKRNPPPGPFWWTEHPSTCPTLVTHVTSPAQATDPAPHHHHHRHNKVSVSQGTLPSNSSGDLTGISTGEMGAVDPGEGEGGARPTGNEEGAGGGLLSSVESRALQWHGWAKAAAGHNPKWGTYQTLDLHRSAVLLACTPPYTISLDSINIQIMHSDAPPPHLLGVALNGVVVGLASAATSSPATGPSALPVCHGVGLIRAVDKARRLLYVLTPLPLDVLRDVDTLLVGRAAAELPTSLLQVGALSAASPYLSLFGLGGVTGAAAGAAGGRPRKNVGRTRLDGATQ